MKRKILLFLFSLILTFSAGNLGQVFGQIKGQLLKANGKPLAYTEIELVPVDSEKIVTLPSLIGISDAAGRFSFVKVPPGKYTLSINFDDKPTELSPYPTFFYPAARKRAEAEVFEINSASPVKTIAFKLPPALSQLRITGRVVNDEGKPMADVYIHLRDAAYDGLGFVFNTRTDKNGAFTLTGFENRLYQVGAMLLAKPLTGFEPAEPLASTSTDVFILTPQTPSVTLTLKDPSAGKKQDGRIGRLFFTADDLKAGKFY